MPILQRAVIRGHVVLQSAQFVASGLRFGFKCGVDISRMRGRRVFRNYPTAFAAATQVTEAVRKRISASKTLCLGIFDRTRKHLIPFPVYTVFPMGAVAKKLEAASRPVDDHTRTLLNLATDLSGLRHSCRTQKEVAALFFKFFSMAVKDVSDAFPLIPLHPDLWPFMLFQWFDVGASGNGEPDWCLFVHLFAGFGMAGLPGVWKILFQDVLLGMARSEQQLTLPVPIFVDDAAIIGSDAGQVDAEAARRYLGSARVREQSPRRARSAQGAARYRGQTAWSCAQTGHGLAGWCAACVCAWHRREGLRWARRWGGSPPRHAGLSCWYASPPRGTAHCYRDAGAVYHGGVDRLGRPVRRVLRWG